MIGSVQDMQETEKVCKDILPTVIKEKSIPYTEKTFMKISYVMYDNHERIDLRRWFMKDAEKFYPMRRGISFPKDYFIKNILPVLNEIVEDQSK